MPILTKPNPSRDTSERPRVLVVPIDSNPRPISNERRVKMIGMDFISFLILLIISVVVSGILHFGFKYYIVSGYGSYLSKVLVGWIGAWLGSPVFGHWWQGLNYKEVYIIPAILGCLLLSIFAVDCVKSCSSAKSAEAPPPSPE